jgi:hypothetical protein
MYLRRRGAGRLVSWMTSGVSRFAGLEEMDCPGFQSSATWGIERQIVVVRVSLVMRPVRFQSET